MNFVWKKLLGAEYDQQLVEEFRKEDEVNGKTMDYATSAVKFKFYWAVIGACYTAKHAMNVARAQNNTGRPFLNVNVPIPCVGVEAAACGGLFACCLTRMTSKVLFRDDFGDKEKARAAFNDWLKEKRGDSD